mmetsp:Transcript_27393/g.57350  ORF Transcript_27393/g.57350 Transcript_27393/m.57350 type:complete len:121 (-) Transcript_27393:133-495(-)
MWNNDRSIIGQMTERARAGNSQCAPGKFGTDGIGNSIVQLAFHAIQAIQEIILLNNICPINSAWKTQLPFSHAKIFQKSWAISEYSAPALGTQQNHIHLFENFYCYVQSCGTTTDPSSAK